MKSYLILLNLIYGEETYTGLINYLKSASYWARPMTNAWIIKGVYNATDIRDGIRKLVNPLDKVLVIEVKNDNWASSSVTEEVTEWMKKNL